MGKLIDLTNTTWKINSLTCSAGYGKFYVGSTLTRNGEYYSSVSEIYIGYKLNIEDFSRSQKADSVMFGDAEYVKVDDIITFIDGSDVANSNLISWLTSNATQIVEEDDIPRIIYNGQVIAELGDGEVTILCIGKKMLTDIVIVNPIVEEPEQVGFKQVYPTASSKYNYTCTLSNMDTSKVYSLWTDYYNGNVFFIKYSNNVWTLTSDAPYYLLMIYDQTVSSIEFYVNGGGTAVSSHYNVIVIEGNTEATLQDFESLTGEEILPYAHCLIQDTPITLADNSYKLIQDITYENDLLVWDFDKGEFTSAKPIWIQKQRKAIEYNHLVFSDGSELNTINQHRIFNVERGMFTYPMTDDTPIGTTTFNDKGEYITLVSKEVIEKEVNYYNIITDYHINLFAGTILTSCRLSNIYPIENMKYVKDNRDIIDYEEFNNIPIEYYYGLRLGEQPVDINRDGAVSFGDTSVEDYVKRLIQNKKE